MMFGSGEKLDVLPPLREQCTPPRWGFRLTRDVSDGTTPRPPPLPSFFVLRKRPPEPLAWRMAWRWRDSCRFSLWILRKATSSGVAGMTTQRDSTCGCFSMVNSFLSASPVALLESEAARGGGDDAVGEPVAPWGKLSSVEATGAKPRYARRLATTCCKFARVCISSAVGTNVIMASDLWNLGALIPNW
ncbi:hypothetical protein GUJ93_ZPchr0005g14883 [Zizania palustris]|uniref:Uncharacterized protein n=1 Tax=Zizania palustris TaxID=103762 RepID=A0A8J5SNV8_ZIZPA|nr:hypothetical protein GUJ93_ZPchr0005g14883 [Zizania palustris]